VTFPTGGASLDPVQPACSWEPSSGIPPAPPSQAVSFDGSISQAKTSDAGAAISMRPFVSIPMARRLAVTPPI
jgi:hypothetical protein